VEDGVRPEELRRLLSSQSEQDKIRILTTPTEDEKQVDDFNDFF
jgi:hypothetical protein